MEVSDVAVFVSTIADWVSDGLTCGVGVSLGNGSAEGEGEGEGVGVGEGELVGVSLGVGTGEGEGSTGETGRGTIPLYQRREASVRLSFT